MRKINLIFAAVFAAAIIIGGVNQFAAVGAVDKNGAGGANRVHPSVDKNDANNVDTVGASRVHQSVDKNDANNVNTVGANFVRPPVDKNRADAVDKNDINLVRPGRRIQVDGFLLEWRGADAHVWPGSNWRWDAVSTADGVAGYVSLPPGVDTAGHSGINAVNDTADSAARADWVLTLRAVNTGRSLEIKLPSQSKAEFFAFDKGLFEAGGPLTAEWIVPWDFFDDGEDSDMYELSISASDTDGVVLHPLVLTVEAPGEPQAPSGLLTRLTMIAIIAALTIALVVIRRRQMRERR